MKEEGWLKQALSHATHSTHLSQALAKLPDTDRSAFVLLGTNGTCIPLTRAEADPVIRARRRKPAIARAKKALEKNRKAWKASGHPEWCRLRQGYGRCSCEGVVT